MATPVAEDEVHDVQWMDWIEASSSNSTNRFVEYKTGGHGTMMFAPHPDLPDQIVAWYQATLLGKGAPASTDNRARREAPATKLLLMTDEPDGGAKIVRTLTAERQKNPKSAVLDPRFVNELGYVLLGENDPKGGIAVLAYNADAHPQSNDASDCEL